MNQRIRTSPSAVKWVHEVCSRHPSRPVKLDVMCAEPSLTCRCCESHFTAYRVTVVGLMYTLAGVHTHEKTLATCPEEAYAGAPEYDK